MIRKYFTKKRRKRSLEIEEVTAVLDEPSELQPLKDAVPEEGMKFIRFLVLAAFLFLAFRVFYLQVVKGEYFADLAKENRLRGIVVKAPRGLIFDRNGKKLVQNIPSFDLVAVPADMARETGPRREDCREVAEIFGMNEQSVSAAVESQNLNSLNPVLLKENISQEEALIFSEKKNHLEGFVLDKTAVRQYENGECFSFLMGYSGKITREEFAKFPEYLMTDYVGKTGLEASYEKYLHGTHGKQEVEVDSSGEIKKNFGIRSPVNGSDLVLGIDADLQKKIFDSLQEKIKETGTKTAAAAAVNPRNGEVLALVSIPGYDNNLFSRGISAEDYQRLAEDEDKPMFNRAISGEYPPGSTLKPMVAAAALQEKTISAETSVNCSGGIRVGSYSFPDWKTHGATDVRKAIAESCDVFFYSIGGGWGDIPGLGIDRMKKYANLFGLGRILGVDIPGEVAGLMPDRSWKEKHFDERWYVGDDYHSAIGQGFDTATPLQIANYIAAIANGGTVYRPHLTDKIINPDGSEQKIESKAISKNFIAPSYIEVVREGMRQTITSGTAQSLKDLPVAVAGKTGTAQFGSEGKTHGWFVSFAPFDNPEIAMAVLVEGGGEGHSTAVPVTKEVYKWYFSR